MITFRPSAKIDKNATLILLTEEQVAKKQFPFTHAALKSEASRLIQSKQFTNKMVTTIK